jgi:hypothetical protein
MIENNNFASQGWNEASYSANQVDIQIDAAAKDTIVIQRGPCTIVDNGQNTTIIRL